MMFQVIAPTSAPKTHVVIDDRGIDDALADGGSHLELEHEDGDEVEEGRARPPPDAA
jgi:hypothetical protein